MKKSDIKILIVLAGVLILAGAIFLYIRPTRDDISSLDSQISDLEARKADLQGKLDKKQEYEDDITKYNDEFDTELAKYPSDLDQEKTVLFMKGVEENNEFINNSFSLPQSTQFYVLGQGATDGSTVTTDAAPADGSTEGTTDGSASGSSADTPYTCVTEAYSVSYSGTYQGLKDYLDYIANYRYRMNVSTLNIAYNADAEDPKQECTGSVTLNAYAIEGGDRAHEGVDINVPEGKQNIFAEGNASSGRLATSSDAAVSYDADDGADIIANHNLVLLLNNASNDAASGIIVATKEDDEKTFVTYNGNDTAELDLNIYNEDGKNFVEYTIGSNSYKEEILTSDVTIYVKSSARVDSNDKNSVDVKLTNTSTLPVYIKVEGDDSTSPRFNLAEKSGSVKVY